MEFIKNEEGMDTSRFISCATLRDTNAQLPTTSTEPSSEISTASVKVEKSKEVEELLGIILYKPEQEEIIPIDTESVLSTPDLKGSFRRHIYRIKRAHSSYRGLSTMELHWDKLLRYDIRSFALKTIYQEFEKSTTENKHHYQGRKLDNIYVAVSTILVLDYSRARTYFSGSYFGFMDTLLNKSNYQHEDIDLAHWIFCYGGKDQYVMNLTFIPTRKLVGPDSISVLPDELLTEEEKEMAGLSMPYQPEQHEESRDNKPEPIQKRTSQGISKAKRKAIEEMQGGQVATRTVECSICGRQLEHMGTFGNLKELEQWYGTVCASCSLVLCHYCNNVGSNPCPQCGQMVKLAQWIELNKINI